MPFFATVASVQVGGDLADPKDLPKYFKKGGGGVAELLPRRHSPDFLFLSYRHESFLTRLLW